MAEYFRNLKLNILTNKFLSLIYGIGGFIGLFVLIYNPRFIDNPLIELSVALFFLSAIMQIILLLKKSYFFYFVRTIFIVLILTEITIGKFIFSREFIVKEFNSVNYFAADTLVGVRLATNLINCESVKLLSNGDTIFNVFYSSDNLGRRIGDSRVDTGNKHAVYLGCSFTFGEGLNFESTFPYLFKVKEPEYASYNYGFVGYGPNQFPFFFHDYFNTINNQSIKNDSGFCLYTFFQDHYNRVYGGSSYLSYASATPDVYVENGKLIATKRSWWRIKFSELINKSNICKYLNLQIFYPKTDAFYKRFAAIINYTANEYYKIKPNGKFIVGIYPTFIIYGHPSTTQDTGFLKFLDPKILVFNPSVPTDLWQNCDKYFIDRFHDGHPNKNFNLYYANQFIDFLTFNKIIKPGHLK